MSVIKASSMSQQQHDLSPVSFNFDDVQNAAQGQLNQIKLKAAEIIQQAQEEAKQIRAQAQQQGQQDAVVNAQKSFKQEIERHAATVLPALQGVVREITLAKQQWAQQWENSALHVATAIAEKLIQREIQQQPEISLDMIKQTLQMASGCGEIKVHLNPKDIEAMQQGKDMMVAELKKLAPTDIIANENIAQGGCFVETSFGSIDNTIKSQLQRIESELS